MISIGVNAAQRTSTHNSGYLARLWQFKRRSDEPVGAKMTVTSTSAVDQIAVYDEHI